MNAASVRQDGAADSKTIADALFIAQYLVRLRDESYNLELSKRRIDEVTQYLVSSGVSSNRLKSVSFGESKPAATNATQEGRTINRRVVLTLEK